MRQPPGFEPLIRSLIPDGFVVTTWERGINGRANPLREGSLKLQWPNICEFLLELGDYVRGMSRISF